VHCGWRGNVQNIYAAIIAAMKATYGSKPANLFVCISPSLGPNNAEFMNYHRELPESFWSFRIGEKHFNLWEISRWQLMCAGVLEDHIQIAEVDTCSNEEYFSYRRATHQGLPMCGRQATICALI
jgi:copper oxidase (laccase) domain-containing protein